MGLRAYLLVDVADEMKQDEFIKELRELSEAELQKKFTDSKQELFNLRFRLATKQLVNHREVRRVKRNIARLETLLKERELGIR